MKNLRNNILSMLAAIGLLFSCAGAPAMAQEKSPSYPSFYIAKMTCNTEGYFQDSRNPVLLFSMKMGSGDFLNFYFLPEEKGNQFWVMYNHIMTGRMCLVASSDDYVIDSDMMQAVSEMLKNKIKKDDDPT